MPTVIDREPANKVAAMTIVGLDDQPQGLRWPFSRLIDPAVLALCRPTPQTLGRAVVVAGLGALILAVAWITTGDAGSVLALSKTVYRTVVPYDVRRFVWVAQEACANPFNWLMIIAILLAECAIPADRRQRVLSIGLIHDFFWFTFTTFFQIMIIPLYVGLLRAGYDRFLSPLTIEAAATWPVAFKVTVAIVILDFLGWMHHYLRHKVEWFWYFHMTHHAQREVNLFTGDRFHPVEYLINTTVVFLPTSILGLSLHGIVWIAFATYWYTLVYHGNLKTNYGPLKHFMVTPQSHRIHHSIEERHWNKNFGVLFTVWDRAFGTLYTNYDEYPATGVPDARYPLEQRAKGLALIGMWAAQLLYPFKMMFMKVARAR